MIGGPGLKFQRHTKIESGLATIVLIPLADLILLLLIFFILSSSFTAQTGIAVQLPKAVTSDAIKDETIVVTITGENITYLNNKVVTSKELQKELSKAGLRSRPLLIKADRRVSVGRIVDVWNLCRDLGIERINIATSQEK